MNLATRKKEPLDPETFALAKFPFGPARLKTKYPAENGMLIAASPPLQSYFPCRLIQVLIRGDLPVLWCNCTLQRRRKQNETRNPLPIIPCRRTPPRLCPVTDAGLAREQRPLPAAVGGKVNKRER
ncbi:hypothetical protein SKAU_G00368380 [Synaphobranchus kaupii]|uniref:Uncharacterized protein n=1 Tax=Synaphobranchus kaupii TaxID=118154 RepID=A0A9Q1EFJ9_SYNKA|nr:hypothetical protein SKAU_G00368380 [Synaphobranchus kaupii]